MTRERERERKEEREQKNIHQSILEPHSLLDSFVLLRRGKVQLHGFVDLPVFLTHQLQRKGAIEYLRQRDTWIS